MNHRQLEIFNAVMISGSASRAAELLQVTQPAVSRAIVDLEEAIGFSLFNRIRGRLVPTPEGQLFFSDVRASFLGLDRLRMSAARIRDFGAGSLRIASLAAYGNTLMPRAIKLFRGQHPDTAITFQIALSAQVRVLVVNGNFSIGLAADEVDLSGVEHRVFASGRASCVMPPGHPLSARAVIHPADLDGVPFIALSAEDRARGRMNAVLDAAGVRPNAVVETPFAATVCALALEGVGVGLAQAVAAEGFLERGLVMRPFEPEVYFKTYLLFRPDTQKSILVKHFVAALLAARDRGARPSPAQEASGTRGARPFRSRPSADEAG
ncbi:LysR substrate-binding domain-containing protein [Teichococcus vastitatis]|uniref:LysR substrate-binding domain-containing protein n=1 Tax=Teichococcus vastitatis TaxID=2307076 RepID=A0ABS9W788_9PROT|nr:LysR substrate-binding domain-containing protein [Pseudoroseomonas vastitatis]MCI0755159.1 LysR substrate-binding domain-containing protein [Pseudoroseomonas vastitatis]